MPEHNQSLSNGTIMSFPSMWFQFYEPSNSCSLFLSAASFPQMTTSDLSCIGYDRCGRDMQD